ncbi:MAG: hydantoinase/oxoprolinase family protein [Armatimonadetes bacterium]|nr:hydantoinase/oxoprolinase family protein [Armatimonadota bacterium]
MLRIGVDTGGTFTDLVLLGPGRLEVLKVPTSRPSPAEGVEEGVRRLAAGPGFELTHGTTVATNAFLERRGATTALVTTRGFRDLLLLGRGTRPRLYDLCPKLPRPLIDPALCFELGERVSAGGEVLQQLSEAEVRDLVRALPDGVESVAVCLLFSFRRPEHERRVGHALEEAGFRVSLSSDVSPEYREYERASTTALNAYLQPVIEDYLTRLEASVARLGGSSFWVVHSAGAVMTAGEASRRAVATVLSGPAAGVHGAFAVASAAGFRRLMTLDMGGTSTDVSLCPGEISYLTEGALEGLPVRQTMVDIHTVGAGGGSIARVDAAGGLRVGPESAGSVPGPAAYGTGREATVTDAHVVLGRLPTDLAGGAIQLDAARAGEAIRRLAAPMGCSVEEAAAGILGVVSTIMERALRVISVERGYDPREFVLLPFGGAGPLHAAELAERLSIPRVLVPPRPGVLSALGAVVAPRMREFSRTVLWPLGEVEPSAVEKVFAELKDGARSLMGSRGKLRRWVDARYRGQGAPLTVPLPRSGLAGLADGFHRAHRRRFGHARRDFPIELVTLRLRCTETRPGLPREELPPATAPAKLERRISLWLGNPPVPVEASCYRRSELRPGHRLCGPALVLQYDTTTLIPPGWEAGVDQAGNLVLEG